MEYEGSPNSSSTSGSNPESLHRGTPLLLGPLPVSSLFGWSLKYGAVFLDVT